VSEIGIRPMRAGDREQWQPLFLGYCRFYDRSCDESKQQTVWRWLMDPEHVLQGLVAEDEEGVLLGLAHFQPWPNTLSGADVCYLGDLFVSPDRRRKQIGKQLYLAVFDECRRRGWGSLRLLTQKSNQVGQELYDQFGEASDFLFYVSPVPA
jgi:GNAT superfamily N-acetyltransferase